MRQHDKQVGLQRHRPQLGVVEGCREQGGWLDPRVWAFTRLMCCGQEPLLGFLGCRVAASAPTDRPLSTVLCCARVHFQQIEQAPCYALPNAQTTPPTSPPPTFNTRQCPPNQLS